MTHFQIHALPAHAFAHLFDLPDDELSAHQACRHVVDVHPGTPCRVSMQDAAVGETVLLVNYTHQPANSPYQANHAIFVRPNAQQAQILMNTVPEVIRSRLISLRAFDADHMMIAADVIPGEQVAQAIHTTFADHAVAYLHLHNAKPGCFAAHVSRVDVAI